MASSKMHLQNNLTTIFSFTMLPKIYSYDAISTINRFKQLKHLYNQSCWILKFSKTASISSHSLTRPKQLTYHLNYWAYGLHSFPVQSLYPSIRTFLIFMAFTFVFCKLAFSCEFCMITTRLLSTHSSLAHIIY